MKAQVRSCLTVLVVLVVFGSVRCSSEESGQRPADDSPFTEPGWWHHFHADSRNTDHLTSAPSLDNLEVTWTWPDRTLPRSEAGRGVTTFNGAVLSSDQSTLYVTTSWDGSPNFHALEARSGRALWDFDLDPWAAMSSGLVGPDDAIYVADRQAAYAIEPPRGSGGRPAPRWTEPHDHVSLSMGFTPWGEVFEITIEGEVSVYARKAGPDGALLARIRLARDASLPLPIGVGILPNVQESSRLQELAGDKGCRWVTDFAGGQFLTPGQVVFFWEKMGEQGLLAPGEGGVAERLVDSAFGGTFVSNTPSIVKLSDDVARMFVPTIGTFHRPLQPQDQTLLDRFTNEILKKIFFPYAPADQQDALVASLKPAGLDSSGRFALDPSVEHRCANLGGTEPYLYPTFGALSGTTPVDPDTLPSSTLAEKKSRAKRIADMKDDYRRLTRGYYTGYLQMIDWDRTERQLTLRIPLDMESPSGTSPAVSPPEARPDRKQLVFLAAGSTLFAYEVGTVESPPSRPFWAWDAGLPVGGSPTVFLPQEIQGGAGGGPAVAVLSGFRGVTMVQDRPEEDCDPAASECCAPLDSGSGPDPQASRRCRVLYDTNPLPFKERPLDLMKTREEMFYDGEFVILSVGTSVPEAGSERFNVAFTEGPANDEFYERHGIGNLEGYMPLWTRYAVVRSFDGKILQEVPIEEAPICDSALSKDGSVYAIHTSASEQIKHVFYPSLFPIPFGGVVALGNR